MLCLQSGSFYVVIPPGLEPGSSESESDILSIELWDLFNNGYKSKIKKVKF